MTVIPPGYAEVVSEFEIPGDAGPALVVFGVDPATETDPTAIAEIIGPIWDTTSGLLNAVSNFVALREVRVTYGQDGGPDTVGAAAFNIVGGDTGAPSSPQVAYLLRKVTGFGGRAYRGRMYLPGVTEAAVDAAGVVLPSAVTILNTAAAEFLSTLEGAGLPMVLLHTSGTITPTPVNSMLADRKVATQRRRLR